MIHLQAYNSYQISRVVRSLQRLLIGVTGLLTLLAGFFAYQWYQAASRDITYLVQAESTQAAYKRPASITRDAFELENFTVHFLQNAFAHNEFTYKDHLNKALQVMDRKSGLYLKSKFKEEEIEEGYKAYNGVSVVEVERNRMYVSFTVAKCQEEHIPIHLQGYDQVLLLGFSAPGLVPSLADQAEGRVLQKATHHSSSNLVQDLGKDVVDTWKEVRKKKEAFLEDRKGVYVRVADKNKP